MPNWLRFPLTLLVIGTVAGGGLAWVEGQTKPRIDENKKRKLVRAFQDVTGFKSFRELPGAEKCYELQDQNGAPLAYAAEAQCPRSYNSRDPIAVVAVFDVQLQKVLLVRTTNNKETPGLGTKASDEAPPPPYLGPAPEQPLKYPFLDKYRDRPADKLAYEKGTKFDAITGATVSSKAILSGVKAALENIQKATGKVAGANAVGGATKGH
jgi:Na+-translocating ferredoxin:NAD+ oxidoreductase RnfG subunit